MLGTALTGCAPPVVKPAIPPDPTGPAASRVGINLAGVIDYSTELPFADCFKASRPWLPVEGDTTPPTDDHGHLRPPAAAWTLCNREIAGHYPKGRCVCTYAGQGDVELRRWDVTRVANRQPGRIEADVTPGDGGLEIRIARSEASDPIRDLKVWMPGLENAASPFNPAFTERIKPFPVLRFMDWGRTNGCPLVRWADRPTLEDARYSTDKGVPIELMVDLANRRGADPWFCIPHRADDNFMRQFAKLVRANLDPKRRVYIELSNEVWNFQFAQTRWANEQGKAQALGDPQHLRFYADRSVRMFELWEQAFGGRDRLVRVLSAQFGNPWTGQQVLKWHDAGKHADAFAVAPYFGNEFGDPKRIEATKALGIDGLLDALDRELDTTYKDLLAKNAAVARQFGLPLIAYEAGQHLAGHGGAENDEALTALFLAANRHPRMAALYTKQLQRWQEAGGGLLMAFSSCGQPSKWGSWGSLEYIDQPVADAPKYRALTEWIAAHQATP